MFSPDPKAVNSYVEAIVVYENGNTRNWAFPRMEQLTLTQRTYQERYRKYVEYLKEDNYSPLWPDAAKYIARLNGGGPSPVKMVLLVRYWSNMVVRPDGSFESTPWDQHVFYAYQVSPGKPGS